MTHQMSHGTRMNESRHTYDWVTSHVYASHVRRGSEARQKEESKVGVVMARSATQLHTHTQMREGEDTTKHWRNPEINQATQK